MSIFDRIRTALSPAVKAIIPAVPLILPWQKATYFDQDFATMNEQAYKGNSAVFACLSALAFGFIEPPLKVYDAGQEELSKHPTRKLIITPNDLMGEGELMLHTITYMAIGGNAYWHKLRNGQGLVIGLEPFHIGNISPVPNYQNLPGPDGRISRILRYDFDNGTGAKVPIDKADIVHFKWPSVDLAQPWIAMPPLYPALREIATDNEAIRYLKAILQNDAVPRMVMYVPADSDLDLDTQAKQDILKSQWRAKYGGDNRGDIAIVTGGAKVERVSLNLEELAFDAIHRIPESRITADLRVPAIIAGLNTGLENSTYSNFKEAKEAFTRGTLAPLWSICASEVAADQDLNTNGDLVSFDLAQVQALQEDVDAKWGRYTAALDAGGITVNQFLGALGMDTEPGGDVRLIPSSKIIVKMDSPDIEIVGQPETPEPAPAQIEPPEIEPDEDETMKRLKMMEESIAHNGVWYGDLQCPICYSYGATVYPDHKGLAICNACTLTFDPAIEGVTNGNGRG